MTNFQLSIHFFLQLAFIIVICRLVGLAVKRISQPQVVGEMIAGVLMGPSLLGLLSPSLQTYLFPPQSMTVIYAVSQLGLVLYMFLVGLEFNFDIVRNKLNSAVTISLAGIIVPFALGSTLAIYLVKDETFFAPSVLRWEAALFMGAAMSITAFPMLARIIYERRLSGTMVGTLALAAGSMDDAAAWCLLAIVLASFGKEPTIAIWAIGGGLIYVLIVVLIRYLLLHKIAKAVESEGNLTGAMLSVVLIILMIAAWFTDIVGIYAVFGAFILGAAMPRGLLTEKLTDYLEPLTTNFMLPLFFIYSGLNTKLGLVSTPTLWLYTLFILLIACGGKGVACYLAARWNGIDHHSAAGIGTLMNARGLMELIILNIGLERGLITPTLFTIMVVMAIVTTLMATPMFNLVAGRSPVFSIDLDKDSPQTT